MEDKSGNHFVVHLSYKMISSYSFSYFCMVKSYHVMFLSLVFRFAQFQIVLKKTICPGVERNVSDKYFTPKKRVSRQVLVWVRVPKADPYLDVSAKCQKSYTLCSSWVEG